jgi:trehalose utilization protein
MRTAAALALAWIALAPPYDPALAEGRQEPKAALRVLVWDEQQEQQKQAYPNYLGNAIADHLKKQEGLEVRSVSIKDPEQGIPDANLEWADVVVWWSHVRDKEVADRQVRKIVERVKAGKCGFVGLHSAILSKPFKALMYERFKEDALKGLPAGVDRTAVDFVREAKEGAPKVVKQETRDGRTVVTVVAPQCMIAGWREDGAPSRVETRAPDHPVAKGFPAKWEIRHTEMYKEPWSVPEPDTVVFHETWDKGEQFRGGCAWKVGEGRVFYFRPGHETYPVFREELPLKAVHDAALWVGRRT